MKKKLHSIRPWLIPAALVGVALALTVPWCYLVIKATYDRDVSDNAQALARRVEQHFRIASTTPPPRRLSPWMLLDESPVSDSAQEMLRNRKMLETLGAEMGSDATLRTMVVYRIWYDERGPSPVPKIRNAFAFARNRQPNPELLEPSLIERLARQGTMKETDRNSYRFLIPWKEEGRVVGVTYLELSREAIMKEFWSKETPLLLQVVAWTCSGVLALSGIAIFAWRAWLRAGRVEVRAELARQGLLAERGLTAAVLAHEIRNPLQALRLQLHSLRRNAANPDRTTSTAETIDSELSRIQQLVTDYLAHEKAVSLRVQSVDLEESARKLNTVLGELLAQTHTDVTIISPHHPVLAACDPHALRQVLMNLVLNAQQAMGHGGRIVIRIGQDEESRSGTIDVSDTGPGIPDEIRSRIFKPFQTSKKEGHGIGLALVKRFVDNFGGSVSVDTEAGKGTTFHLKLPLADGLAENGQSPMGNGQEEGKAESPKLKVES